MTKDHAEPLAILPKNSREDVRITLCAYQGRPRLDIRQWADTKAGAVDARCPTKQGVNLSADQIPHLIEALLDVHRKALEQGLIGEAA